MPISKNRRKTTHKKKLEPKPLPKWMYSRFALKEEHHTDLKTVVLEVARKSVAYFPATLKSLNDELRKSDPIGILATLAFYGLQTTATQSEGVAQNSFLKNILQHHVEVLQAIVLAISVEEWPSAPFTPDVIQRVLEILPKITDTFQHQRTLAAEGVRNKIENTLLFTQDRIRLHTQGVRNWGYFSEVVRISTELLAPLDQQLHKYFGFGASDLIRVMNTVVHEAERRNTEHFNTLAKIIKEPTAKRMLRAYYDNVPDLVGNADELLGILPSELTREGMMSIVMGHYDLRLSKRATFTSDEIADLTGIDTKIIAAALTAISLEGVMYFREV